MLGAVRSAFAARGVSISTALWVVASASQAQSQLPRIPTAQLRPGSHVFAPDPYSEPPNESEILLVREKGGRLHAWYVPVRKGLRRLPDDERWSPGPPCAKFAVDFTSDTISCRDTRMPAEILLRYRWSISGRRLTEFVPDLIPIPGKEEGGFFVLHR